MAKTWYSKHSLTTELRRVVDTHARGLRSALRPLARLATYGKLAQAIRRGHIDRLSRHDQSTVMVYHLSKVLLGDSDSLRLSAISLRPWGFWGRVGLKVPELFRPKTANRPVLPLVTDFLRIDLARSAVEKAREGTRRAMRLLASLTDTSVSARAEAYLQRVAQSYIWGFDTEAVMLARSVLESALEEKVPHQRVIEALAKSPESFRRSQQERLGKGYPSELVDRINAAPVLGVLSVDVAKMATDIRIRGNNAVHKNVNSDSLDTIEKLVTVLNALR